MLWNGRESDNVEDGRGSGGGGRLMFGGGLGAAVIGIIIYFLGGDPSQVLNQAPLQQSQETSVPGTGNDTLVHRTKVILAYTEDVWDSLFRARGQHYDRPKLHMYSGYVESGCGGASSSTGPFYCPMDQKVYLDLSFFQEMEDRFHVEGDFPMAYVIAHEVGHHVQNLLGISEKAEKLMQQSSKTEANKVSVKLELQADFFAGVWAHHAQRLYHILEGGDVEEALNAASAVGDDRLQQQQQGRIVPDAFTHGTSQQRMYWFKKGYETGDMEQGDTFNSDLAAR